MPWMIPAAMVAGSVVSGVMANNAAGKASDSAQAARNNAIQQFLATNVPDPAQQQLELQRFQSTGQLSPQLEQAFQQQSTELGGISLDPTSRDAELQALSQMQNLAGQHGLDDQAKSQIQAAINATNANAQGQRQAIVQNFAQRGMGGSGAELQAQLLATQADANQASNTGQSAAASSEQRALQAMMNSSQMGSQLNNQDYSQAAAAARAQDAINQFNTQNMQTVSNANTGIQNNAQQYNLKNSQDISNMNTGIANEEQTHNKGLYQQQFGDQMQRASGASGQYQAQANGDMAIGQQNAGMWSGIGSAIAQGGAAYGQNQNSQAQLDAYNSRTNAMYPKANAVTYGGDNTAQYQV